MPSEVTHVWFTRAAHHTRSAFSCGRKFWRALVSLYSTIPEQEERLLVVYQDPGSHSLCSVANTWIWLVESSLHLFTQVTKAWYGEFVWSWDSIENSRRFSPENTFKVEMKFEKPYLLCVCCVFRSFWRPFWAIFCVTVGTWHDIASTVKQKIAKTTSRSSEKR